AGRRIICVAKRREYRREDRSWRRIGNIIVNIEIHHAIRAVLNVRPALNNTEELERSDLDIRKISGLKIIALTGNRQRSSRNATVIDGKNSRKGVVSQQRIGGTENSCVVDTIIDGSGERKRKCGHGLNLTIAKYDLKHASA